MVEFGNILKLKPVQFANGLDMELREREESKIISRFRSGGSEHEEVVQRRKQRGQNWSEIRIEWI